MRKQENFLRNYFLKNYFSEKNHFKYQTIYQKWINFNGTWKYIEKNYYQTIISEKMIFL
jgi:hypothetical protein